MTSVAWAARDDWACEDVDGDKIPLSHGVRKGSTLDQMKLNLITAFVLASVVMSLAPSPETQVVRLSPAAFPELQRRQCTIPQETYSKKRNNVIKGEFAKRIGLCCAR